VAFAALPVVALIALDRAAAGFAAREGYGLRDATLLGDFTVASVVADIATQAAYIAAGLALPLGALVGASLGARRWPREAFIAIAFAAAVALQPLVLAPDWTGRAALRLGALAIVPVAVAVAIVLRPHPRRVATPAVVVAVAAIALGSLRHAYTWLPGNHAIDTALTLAAGAAILAACYVLGSKQPPRVR
jgi:hypothetical protein